MTRTISILTGVMAAVLASPAGAADRKEEVRMRRFAATYAKCVVRTHHERASMAVLSASDNADIKLQFHDLISPDCLETAAGVGADARFPANTMQAALADALVSADFATHGDASFADRLPLAQPSAMTEEETATAVARAKSEKARQEVLTAARQRAARAWLARYGECVVRESPEAARFWLLTPTDTPEEISRIKALQPAFGACLGAGTMKFNRGTMRNTVAINYYRLAKATHVSGTGGGR